MRMLWLFSSVVLLALVGCSTATISSPPTSEEAQAAINAQPSGQAFAGQKPPAIYVTDVKVGACKSSATNPLIVCDTAFAWEGTKVNTRVAYWNTSNPRHPWRAKFIPTHSSGR